MSDIVPHSYRPANQREEKALIERQFSSEYGTDITEYINNAADLKNQGESAHFIDQSFPPTQESLCENWSCLSGISRVQVWEKITWLRPSEFLSDTNDQSTNNIQVFGKITPSDIQQGKLENLYFLSALSCLAEKPSFIRRLFKTDTYQKNGLYSIWLHIQGEWKNIVIDDYIPCIDRKPAFSHSTSNQLWVLLLEKAYAKAHGSYFKIEGGNPFIAMNDITGSQYEAFSGKNSQELLQYLRYIKENNKESLLLCTFPQTSNMHINNQIQGFIPGQFYSILSVCEISNAQQAKVDLIQIRNPWGFQQWDGVWSNNSHHWDDESRRQVKEKTVHHEQTVLLSIYEFWSNFANGVGVIQMDEDIYNSIPVSFSEQKNQAVIKLRLKKDARNYTITLNQKDIRSYENNYKYSFVRILVVKQNERENSWVQGTYDYGRNVSIKLENIYAGEYLIYVEIQWNQTVHRNIVLSCFGDAESNLSLLGNANGEEFCELAIQSYSKFLIKNDQHAQSQNMRITRYNDAEIISVSGFQFGLLFYYFSNKSFNTTVVSNLSLSKLTGLQLPSSIQGKQNKEIKIVLPINKDQVIVFRCDPNEKLKLDYSIKSKLLLVNQEQCEEKFNENLFVKDLKITPESQISNIKAEERKIEFTYFKYGLNSFDQKESAVSVISQEAALVNFLSKIIAPLVSDWASFFLKLSIIYGILLIIIGSFSCNYFDIVIFGVIVVLFQAQLSTRKRMRKLLLLQLISIVCSFLWLKFFPRKWSSIESQTDIEGKGLTIFELIISILAFIIKVYFTLIYWKLFVSHEEVIQNLYQSFSFQKRKTITI